MRWVLDLVVCLLWFLPPLWCSPTVGGSGFPIPEPSNYLQYMVGFPIAHLFPRIFVLCFFLFLQVVCAGSCGFGGAPSMLIINPPRFEDECQRW